MARDSRRAQPECCVGFDTDASGKTRESLRMFGFSGLIDIQDFMHSGFGSGANEAGWTGVESIGVEWLARICMMDFEIRKNVVRKPHLMSGDTKWGTP